MSEGRNMLGRMAGNLFLRRSFASACCLAAVYGVYVYVCWDFLTTRSAIVDFDNINYHFPDFAFYANAFANGYGLPVWQTDSGGIPTYPVYLSMFPYLPYKLVGYAIYAYSSLDLMSSYKWMLVVGTLMISTGWWVSLAKWTGSRAAATAGAAIFVLSGAGFTSFHQEQIISTMFYIPWFFLALLKTAEDERYILPLGAVGGALMTVHYPQIHLLWMLAASAYFLIMPASRRRIARILKGRPALVAASLAVFFVSASPTAYIGLRLDDFSSPVREISSMETDTLDKYLKINTMQRSSMKVSFLKNLALPVMPKDIPGKETDKTALYLARVGMLLAAVGICLRFRASLPAVFLSLFGAWAAVGINGGLPQFLFRINFPFIEYFRQWYHFFPLIVFGLSALSAQGFLALKEKSLRFAGGTVIGETAMTITMGALVVIAALSGGRAYGGDYLRTKMGIMSNPPPRPTHVEYVSMLKNLDFRRDFLVKHMWYPASMIPSRLISFRERYEFRDSCVKDYFYRFFISSLFYSYDSRGIDDERRLMEAFCDSGLMGKAVYGKSARFRGISGISAIPLEGLFQPPSGGTTGIYAGFKSLTVTPLGLEVSGNYDGYGIGVFPLVHREGITAEYNGAKAETIPIFGGTMTGVYITGGPFRIKIRMRGGLFEVLLAAQAVLLLLCIAYPVGIFIFDARAKRKRETVPADAGKEGGFP